MKLRHHQLFVERIVLFIFTSPSSCLCSKYFRSLSTLFIPNPLTTERFLCFSASQKLCSATNRLSVEEPRRQHLSLSSTSTPSCMSSAFFIARPPWYPPSVPSERIARWQGMTMGKGFVARALPTAPGAPGNAQMGRDPPVRAHGTPRDGIFRQKDSLLKRGQRSSRTCSSAKRTSAPSRNAAIRPARSSLRPQEEGCGTGELGLQAHLRRLPRSRDQDLPDHGFVRPGFPQDDCGAEARLCDDMTIRFTLFIASIRPHQFLQIRGISF